MISSDPSLRNKSLRACNKVAHVKLLRWLARPVPRYAVTVIYRNQQRKKQKRFSVLRKKEQSQKQKKNNDDFQKVVIYNKMHEIKISFCFPEKKQSQKQNKK